MKPKPKPFTLHLEKSVGGKIKLVNYSDKPVKQKLKKK
jgi:hypothetical protein